jgi:hypothetical protein
MKAKIFLCSLAIFFSGVFMFSSSAVAVTPNPDCVQDAKDERNLCVFNCQEAFRADKDACRNVNHDCADGCRVTYVDCVDDLLTALATCKTPCLEILELAKTACRSQWGAGTVERDACIDGVQLAAFACRDRCREDFNVNPGLKACRVLFGSCIKACSPATL